MSGFAEVQKAFTESTGLEHALDLFRNWTDSTTILHYDVPLSIGRFVTIAFEPWSLMKLGSDGHITIKVWCNRCLHSETFVKASDIFYALDRIAENGFRRKDWDDGRNFEFTWYGNGEVQLRSYLGDKDRKYDIWDVTLMRDEIQFLAQRLAPLRDYAGIEQEALRNDCALR